MQAVIPEPSPQKAGRRVLGEKTANASLTPATKRVADASSQKFQTTAIPFNVLSNKISPSKTRDVSSDVRHAGQKRSIDQVVEDIKEAESEPRKVLMTSQTEEDRDFEIFNDANGTESRKRKILEASTSQQTDGVVTKSRDNVEANREGSKDESLSRVPTEPAARKLFIQQRAALAKSRLQSAMRRVEDKSLDRALSQFEANSRSFLRTLSSSSASTSQQPPQQEQISQNPSTTKQTRVLLPPLPLQPRSRPVRSSAQTSTHSPSAESLNIASPPATDDEAEPNYEHDNDKTPKQSDIKRQDNITESHDIGVNMSQESDSVIDKLIKWTQSSTDSIPTAEA
ncbi:conserved hypothetical protein [Talaromyces stipitatus ATCC 10500]|uniref:Uncharacterized protein n=1 Tax=Talaromyces stipitatus (strain ATCC 10500 / CBS 375.48 / QM 6759 / NRRL 1006) TaxID=441959 RepID=B8M5Q1_TALSN|nr:uncharacterized protein TSTA_032040 [Talaromyces stipitatus ATCC 10500]EED19945.1 conserved hypothetical protein [Talaromyces stipitatus ATCC 10500]